MAADSLNEAPPRVTADDLCRRSFWRSLAPALSVGAAAPEGAGQPRQSSERLLRRMSRDGYFSDGDDGLAALAPAIAEGIRKCIALGLPPVFVWLYDEPWTCFARLKPALSLILGENYKLLPAFWAWHVDPAKAQSGWAPHRDNSRSLLPDGTPATLTCWIPITDANPLNSCMYIVPAHLDPNYKTAATTPDTTPPFHAIRAVPAKPGDYLIWNQVVCHWGAPSSEFGEEPRMSIALEFQRADVQPFNSPLLDQNPYPDFGTRLKLVGKQVLQYQHMYGFSRSLTELAQYLLTAPVQND